MNSTANSLEPDIPVRREAPSPFWPFRYSGVALLAALAFLLIITPFVEDLPRGELVEAALMSLVLVSAVLGVGGVPGKSPAATRTSTSTALTSMADACPC